MLAATASAGADRERLHAAAQALEALVVKQLVVASKAFTGGDSAGSGVRADMFADALADAMVKGGGIGLASQLERSVQGGAASTALTSAAPAAAPAARAEAAASATTALSAQGVTGASPTVTSPFGLRHDPFDGHLTRHQGVDLRAAEGEAVRAAGAGVVRRSGPLGGYGEAVEIDHGNGLTTLYGHASELLVHEGETVTPGQAIARVGHSGRATGPHLHFEVRQDGKALDPEALLEASGQGQGLAQPLLEPVASPPEDGFRAGTRLRANLALKIYGRRADETSESGS